MKRLRSVVVLAIALATMLALPSAGGAADRAVAAVLGGSARSAAAGGATALPAGHAWTVTMVTGDVVGVRTVSGRPPQVTVRPGPGRRGVIFSSYVDTRGHIRVLPRDVAPLVGPVLDPTLFDVTALIENGDDDAHRSTVPLIVQARAGASESAAAAALPGALPRGVTLSSINAGRGAGAEIRRQPDGARAGRDGFRRRTGGPGHAAGHRADPLHLAGPDGAGEHGAGQHRAGQHGAGQHGRVSAATAAGAQAAAKLDHNLAQIGAPAAWRAGDTGRGVRVAVLDTGVDATQPDLKGQIAAGRNFSKSPGMVDRFGHGTFVAAQVAGTGRAAGGERRGVAFGARLVIGKVLNDDGAGLDSTIIAGMQWAATRARVISMSLGWGPSDGTGWPSSRAGDRGRGTSRSSPRSWGRA